MSIIYEYAWRAMGPAGPPLAPASSLCAALLGGSALIAVLALAILARKRTRRPDREAEGALRTLARELEAQVQARTAELQESQAQLQGFIRHAPAAIAFKGPDGRFLLATPSYASLLGVPAARLIGRTLDEVLPMDLCGPWMDQERRVLARREELESEEPWPRDGSPVRQYRVRVFPLLDESGRCWGVGVLATDITDQKDAEQAALQKQKLESLGILAGGLAHDFNNLLGAMEGNVELAKLVTNREGPVHPYLQTLEELIGRSGALVQQILAYSGRGRTQVAPMDLNHHVEAMMPLLRASLARRASLRTMLGPGLPLIQGDPGQLQQVIMNLVLNAFEAGEAPDNLITIRTSEETLSAPDIRSAHPGQALEPGPHVCLEIADNGPGMPPDVLERIFDPFYTTKCTGRGLGLSAVLGALRAHRGGIQVRSEPGRGTTFRLLLPASAQAEEPAQAGDFEEAMNAYRGSGTLLVVDDEDPLRAAVAEALRHIGYDPLEARDGLEALQVLEANRDRVQLVLMDLTMPRMDGEEAYRQLRAHGMLAPVLLTSGFSEAEVLRHFRSKGIAGFLQKPYRLLALARMVWTVLERERPDRPMAGQEPSRPLLVASGLDSGFPLLDQQHALLARAFNQLVANLGTGVPLALQEQALAALKEVALTHFGVEETLMDRLAYPRTREHQQCHARLIIQISELTARIHQRTLRFTPSLLDFLESWLVHHMQDEDRQLTQFVSGQGH